MKPYIGLALSGGTARSVTHVGVVKALIEADIPIDCLAGTSGGSIVTTLLASGVGTAELEEHARGLSWNKLASLKLSKMGFATSKRIEQLMEELLGDCCFEDLKIPCVVTATDLMTGEKRVFTQGPIARAVRASCSIPQIFLPVEIDGKYYVDGGLSEYLPAQSVRNLGATFVIGAHLSGSHTPYEKPGNLLQLIMQLTNLIARQNLVPSLKATDYVIAPEVKDFSAFDFGPADELMELGYETTKRHIPHLKRIMKNRHHWWNRLGLPLIKFKFKPKFRPVA